MITYNDNMEELQKLLDACAQHRTDPLVWNPFWEDFKRRFCWNTNHIEGNTLSLDETVAVLDYDEVRAGHTYQEYTEAKTAYQAICELLSPDGKKIDANWFAGANAIMTGDTGAYRTENRYIGTLFEAVYYPPSPDQVPVLMDEWCNRYLKAEKLSIEELAVMHIQFERIHPFSDGNGRTGRMILNQCLINAGFLPVVFASRSEYNQAFRRFDRNNLPDPMVHQIYKAQGDAARRLLGFAVIKAEQIGGDTEAPLDAPTEGGHKKLRL